MKVTEKDVAYVADLANLDLSADERAHMLKDLNSILGHIDQLNELNTDNVAPMAQVSEIYGVDKAKTGSERFVYASREDASKVCANRFPMMKRWPMLRRPTALTLKFLKSLKDKRNSLWT